jgi:hypothetical protein
MAGMRIRGVARQGLRITTKTRIAVTAFSFAALLFISAVFFASTEPDNAVADDSIPTERFDAYGKVIYNNPENNQKRSLKNAGFIKIEKVFPDSFTDKIKIHFRSEENLALITALCNSKGAVVYNNDENARIGNNELLIEARNLNDGAYTLVLSDLAGRKKSVRLIKK